MKIHELMALVQYNRGQCIQTDKYEMQIYSGGKRGNILKSGLLVCAFDLDEQGLIIAPVKSDIPYEFGYSTFIVRNNEDIDVISTLSYKDSELIGKAFKELAMKLN